MPVPCTSVPAMLQMCSFAKLREVCWHGQVFTSHFAEKCTQGLDCISCVCLGFWTRSWSSSTSKWFSCFCDAQGRSWSCFDHRFAGGNTLTLFIFCICSLFIRILVADPHCIYKGFFIFLFGGSCDIQLWAVRLACSLAFDFQWQFDASFPVVVLAAGIVIWKNKVSVQQYLCFDRSIHYRQPGFYSDFAFLSEGFINLEG